MRWPPSTLHLVSYAPEQKLLDRPIRMRSDVSKSTKYANSLDDIKLFENET